MVNVNMPPAHANEKWKNFDWDDLTEEPYEGNHSEDDAQGSIQSLGDSAKVSVQGSADNTKGNVQGLSEKDMEHLERLRGMVEEMRRNAASIRIKENEDAIKTREKRLEELGQEMANMKAADEARMQQMNKDGTMTLKEDTEMVRQANLEQKREQIRDLIPKWIEDGNKYIPSGRQAEWAEHVKNLVEVDPYDAKERVEKVLSLMQRLGDDRINLADLKDRASDEDIKKVADFFRKFEMTSPLAGTNLGGISYQKVDEDNNRAYDQRGKMELEGETHLVKASLSDDDRGVLEDLLLSSPQGLRLFQEIWPERFWDEHDRAYVEEAKRRNETDFAEARKAAVESGELDSIIRARQKRQGGLALSAWGGTEQARKRIAWIRGQRPERLKEGEKLELEPEDYWEKSFMDARGVESDDIESTIEVLNALNDTKADVEKAVKLLDDYELRDSHRDFVRKRVLWLHPRGVEFYRESSQKGLTKAEEKTLEYVEKQDEIVEPGIGDKLGRNKKHAMSEARKPASTASTPEQRAKNSAARNAKVAEEEKIRIGSETEKLRSAEAELTRAREELKKFNFFDRFNSKRMEYERALDNVRRAEYAVEVARQNIAGGKSILQRAEHGEM